MRDTKKWSIMEALLTGRINNHEAAAALNLSIRQIKRIKKRVKEKGLEGVVHGNRNRPSARALACKDRVIELVKATYYDFNFTHLSEELLNKENISVSRETLRLWLRPLGYGGKVRKKPHHRKRKGRCSFLTVHLIDGSETSPPRLSCLPMTPQANRSMVSSGRKRTLTAVFAYASRYSENTVCP